MHIQCAQYSNLSYKKIDKINLLVISKKNQKIMNSISVEDANIITQIRYTDNDKKCELHKFSELRTIHYGKIYEIEVTETKWNHSDFYMIVDTFLISDLTKIVYEYTMDVYNLMLIFGECGYKLELYFLSNSIVYNFFQKSDIIFVNGTMCSKMYEYVLRHSRRSVKLECLCDNSNEHNDMNSYIEDNMIHEYTFPQSELENINRAYKIFNFFIQKTES